MSKKDSTQYLLNVYLVVFAFSLAVIGNLAGWLAVNYASINTCLYQVAVASETIVFIFTYLLYKAMMFHVTKLEDL